MRKIILSLLMGTFGFMATAQTADTITFQVDMAGYSGSYTDVNINGDFNGWCGGCNVMSDADGDGIYDITLPLTADSIEFKFTVDGWTDQENFVGGEPCTKTTSGFTNRFYILNGNATLPAVCWNYCVDCSQVPSAADLPIDFESGTTNYAISGGFGGVSDSIEVDPTDPNNTVWRHTKSATAETWGGSIVGFGGLANPIPFTATETVLTMMVWSPDAGAEIRMKLEEASNTSVSVETVDTTTVAGGWELLSFDFSNEAAGTAALDLNAAYNQIVVFPNFGVNGATAGSAKTYYFDNIMFGMPSTQVDLPITFDDPMVDYDLVSFGSGTDSLQADPTDPNNMVLGFTKPTGAQTWAGTVLGDGGLANAIPFSATENYMSVRVWSPDAGTPVLLKVENSGDGSIAVETLVNTTMAGAWETLYFDFTQNQPNTPAIDYNQVYDKVVVFPDFGNPGADKTFYVDDVMFGNAGMSLNEVLNGNNLSVYPNPNQGRFTVNSSVLLSSNAVVEVRDLQGRLVIAQEANGEQTEINAGDLPAGVYMVQAKSDAGTETARIMIK